MPISRPERIEANSITLIDAREGLERLAPRSIALAVWSPPYLMGRSYELDLHLDSWTALIEDVMAGHQRALGPGGMVAVNIIDHRSWPLNEAEPEARAAKPGQRMEVSNEQIERIAKEHAGASQRKLAQLLGCSEQTIARRRGGNNRRSGTKIPTGILPLGERVNRAAAHAGLHAYDCRIWHKSPAWSSCRWHTTSWRAIDEYEHILIYRKTGARSFDRTRLLPDEWASWGSRGVWRIPSVRTHARHEAEFPEELPRRLIRLFSDPEETVLDAFVGSGTTTAVARRLGRRWIGFDRDPANAALASARTMDARYRPETHSV